MSPPAASAAEDTPLAAIVPEASLETMMTAAALLVGRCSDIDSMTEAQGALGDAALAVGLGPDDQRWALVDRGVVAGVAELAPESRCRWHLQSWMLAETAPITVPLPVAPTTTAPPVVRARELFGDVAEPSTPDAFARLRTGMTLDEVRDILGSAGTVLNASAFGDHQDQFIRWPATGGTFAAVRGTFRDGRLLAATMTGSR